MTRPYAEWVGSAGPVLLVWALAGALVSLPYTLAAVAPPPGRTFVGTFHWIDDVHNYASFVQQAEDGRFLFRSKLLLEKHEGVLINLEWWATGLLSRALGRRPFLAYRLVALIALCGLLFAADRALGRLAVPATHRTPALLLIAVGGGLGGLLFELTARPAFRCADLALGYFPFVEALSNPHWLIATWLSLETLLAFSSVARPVDVLRAAALGSILALVRPYDVVLMAGVIAASGLMAGPREWRHRVLPLLGLAPVFAYDYWAFYRSGVFPTYTATAYASPPLADLAWALGPVLIIALAGRRVPAAARPLSLGLWTWAAGAAAVVALRPTTFALQFAVGCGLPLLVLAASALARLRPAVTFAAALVLGTTAVVALRVVLTGVDEPWYVPSARRDVAVALRPGCQPGDLVFAPSDIGLYVGALSACQGYTAHAWEPDHDTRRDTVRAFYTTMRPDERHALLERLAVRHVLLPGDPGATADVWLGPSRFRRTARAGEGAGAISVYTREP